MRTIFSPSLLQRILASIVVVIVFLTTGIFQLSAQTPSGISASDSTYFRRLEVVCKVWGYVKYFHTGMVRSNSWDDVLIRTLQSVKSARSTSEYNAAIEQMISSAGEVLTARSPAETLAKERFLPVDYSWMTDATMLSPTAIAGLANIQKNFRPFQSFYVNASGVGTPQAANENSYASMTAPDEQYRLLALFRHWNLINYFFPYKADIGREWGLALRDMIPVFVRTEQSAGGYGLAIAQMSAQINDSHGFLSNPNFIQVWGDGTLPMEVLHIEGKTVVSALNFTPTVLNSAGLSMLRVGDVITAINGEHVDSIRKRLTPYIPASNASALNRDLNFYILYGPVGDAQVSIQRGSETMTLPSKRISFANRNAGRITPSLPAIWRILDKNIGYVDMGRLQRADVASMMNDLANTRGIVFDVRNYPNGTMYDICAYLGTSTPFVKFTAPDPLHPGTFTAPAQSQVLAPFQSMLNAGATPRYTGTTVALMNAITQSHAEFTLMSLRAMGTTLIGSQTAGADGNVVTVTMPGNIVVYYTSLGVFYPNGTPTQRIGIVPDIRVLPTLAGFQAGRDEVLERGIQAITGTTSVALQTTLSEKELRIFPNPCQDEARVSFALPQSGAVRMRVTNIIGTTMWTQDATAQQGVTTLAISTSALSNGVYICQIITPNGQSVAARSFVVAR
jgi:carboxyl-terminal processing protease